MTWSAAGSPPRRPKNRWRPSNSILTRLAVGGTAVAGAALLHAGTPAQAQVAPDSHTGDLRVIALTQAVPAQDLNPGQIGLGALAGLALAGAGVVAVRAARRPHVAHAA